VRQASLVSRVLYGVDETMRSHDVSPISNGSFSSRCQTHSGGIALWPVATRARTSDGSDVTLLVLDVQDFDAFGCNKGRDECLFSLGMLLSSFVVYHSRGGVTEEEIGKLWSYVSATNKKMQIVPTNERDRADAEVALADLTPKLLWVLHGFSLTRDDSGRQMTARQYLERALQESEDVLQPGGLAKMSAAKTTLRHIFADRDCFPIVHAAGTDASALHGSFISSRSPSTAGDLSSSGNLRRDGGATQLPEERARAQVAALRDRIIYNAEMKCLGGAPLNGRMLLTVAESYIAAINAANTLNVGDALGAIADCECDLYVQVWPVTPAHAREEDEERSRDARSLRAGRGGAVAEGDGTARDLARRNRVPLVM